MRRIRRILPLAIVGLFGCADLLSLGDAPNGRDAGAATDTRVDVDAASDTAPDSALGTDSSAGSPDAAPDSMAVDTAVDVGDPLAKKPALLLYAPPAVLDGRVALLAVDATGSAHVLYDQQGFNGWTAIATGNEPYAYFHAADRPGQTVVRILDAAVADMFVVGEPVSWTMAIGLPDRRFVAYRDTGCLRVMRYEPPPANALVIELDPCTGITPGWRLSAATPKGLIAFAKLGLDDAWLGRYLPSSKTLEGARIVPFGSFDRLTAVGEAFLAVASSTGIARLFDASGKGRPVTLLPASATTYVGLRDGRVAIVRSGALEVGRLVDDGVSGLHYEAAATTPLPKAPTSPWTLVRAL